MSTGLADKIKSKDSKNTAIRFIVYPPGHSKCSGGIFK